MQSYMKAVVLAVLVALVVADGGEHKWKVLHQNYSHRADGMSVSFTSPTRGWVAGGSSNYSLFHTEDGGTTIYSAKVKAYIGGLNAISMYDDTHGVAGVFSSTLFSPCGIYTNDGVTWYPIKDALNNIDCKVFDTVAPAPGVYILIGWFQRIIPFKLYDVLMTTNGGKTWELRQWKQSTLARFAWFKDGEVGYVSGGWKETATASGNTVIAATKDGGKSWKTMQNFTNLCLKKLSCIDEQNCWIAAEGVENEYDLKGYIFHTTDGFETMQKQLQFDSDSFVAIHMISATLGWAAGSNRNTAHFFRWDGISWTEVDTVQDFEPFCLSVVDEDYAFAVGRTSAQNACLARFSPFN